MVDRWLGRFLEKIDDLGLAKHVEAGGLTGEKLATFVTTYLDATTRVHHPANIAHQQAVPHYAASLAGLIDGFVSSDGSIYELGPAAVSIEYFLINWLLEKVGWNPAPLNAQRGGEEIHGGGILTHGGSIANLTALIAARTQIAPEVWLEGNPGNLVLFAPAETHYSIMRAAGIMGLGQRAVYPLEVDKRGVINPDRLPAAYARVEAEGRQNRGQDASASAGTARVRWPVPEARQPFVSGHLRTAVAPPFKTARTAASAAAGGRSRTPPRDDRRSGAPG